MARLLSTLMAADFCSLQMYAGNVTSYDSPRPYGTARSQASLRIIHFLFEILMCNLKGKGSAGCLFSVVFLHASMALLRHIFIYVSVSVGESAMQVLLETREGLGSHGAGGRKAIVSSPAWVLRAELMSSDRTVRTLNTSPLQAWLLLLLILCAS